MTHTPRQPKRAAKARQKRSSGGFGRAEHVLKSQALMVVELDQGGGLGQVADEVGAEGIAAEVHVVEAAGLGEALDDGAEQLAGSRAHGMQGAVADPIRGRGGEGGEGGFIQGGEIVGGGAMDDVEGWPAASTETVTMPV